MRQEKFSPSEEFIAQRMRNVFSTPDGMEVFAVMLHEMKVFDQISEEDRALRNYGVHLLTRMGVFHWENLRSIVNGLLENSIPRGDKPDGR